MHACGKLVGYEKDCHKHSNYEEMRANLRRNLEEVEKWNCPFGIPLFFTGVYTKRKRSAHIVRDYCVR